MATVATTLLMTPSDSMVASVIDVDNSIPRSRDVVAVALAMKTKAMHASRLEACSMILPIVPRASSIDSSIEPTTTTTATTPLVIRPIGRWFHMVKMSNAHVPADHELRVIAVWSRELLKMWLTTSANSSMTCSTEATAVETTEPAGTTIAIAPMTTTTTISIAFAIKPISSSFHS